MTLETVHAVSYVTDNAGRIAYDEPQHEGKRIFFKILAHGYKVPRDAFDAAGVVISIASGGRHEIRLERQQAAERLARLTGADRYRDSRMLGYETPRDDGLGVGNVAGQDSVQAVIYQDSVRWFWGDTLRLAYPLGLFRTAGARTPLDALARIDLRQGLPLSYVTDRDGFTRAMVELPEAEGVVWIDGVGIVRDSNQSSRLVAHYTRRKSLFEEIEHGLVLFDDQRDAFVRHQILPLEERWRHPRGHGVLREIEGKEEWWFGDVFPTIRVPATLTAISNPDSYESWSCLDPADQTDTAAPLRRVDGALDWQWRKTRPVTAADEQRWLAGKLISADECRFFPQDAKHPERRVLLHSGTVRWNPYRGRWVMIAVEMAKDAPSPSLLGEVWYSESDSPLGPFTKAWKILGHDQQSFYNPCHHEFLDQDGGRRIHFEGTYTRSFTTPRYEYNQILYRLDLESPELQQIFGAATGESLEDDTQNSRSGSPQVPVPRDHF